MIIQYICNKNMTKTCNVCRKEYPLAKFNAHPSTKDGRQNQCRFCRNEMQRAYRHKTMNKHTREYEKTLDGFLVRCYRNMKSRISGVQKAKYHLYKGLPIIDKDVFYSWSKQNEFFNEQYKKWVSSGYERRQTPSVDRIDSSKGYLLDNMEWVTFSENCRRGSLNKAKRCLTNYN